MTARHFVLPAAGLALLASGLPAAAQEVAIASHRAIYDMALEAAPDTPITRASGQMLFSWQRDCEGWTTEQAFQVSLGNGEGREIPIQSDYTTFETLDGTHMTFTSRDYEGGEPTDLVSGEANLEEGGGVAVFDEPPGEILNLPADTLFPTEHTVEVIRRAIDGERFYAAQVFDGTEVEGLVEITAVMGQPFEAETQWDIASGQAWRVSLAFFGADADPGGAPDAEIAMDLLANGVVTTLTIDFGNFALRGDLAEIEALDVPACD